MPLKEGFPDFTLFYVVPRQTQNKVYNVFIKTKDYQHTSYPAHLKLTVKNTDHAYAAKLIPYSQCVVTFQFVLSVF